MGRHRRSALHYDAQLRELRSHETPVTSVPDKQARWPCAYDTTRCCRDRDLRLLDLVGLVFVAAGGTCGSGHHDHGSRGIHQTALDHRRGQVRTPERDHPRRRCLDHRHRFAGVRAWFVDNTPSNGKGFEGAVARAVVDKLGYNADQVRFTTVAFNDALKPGPKDFDFDVNQFTVSGDRRENVDFSSPYYAVAQSVIASRGSKAAEAKNLADLAGYRLGAQTGSTSLAAITDTIVPTTAPREFATTDDAKAALAAGEIDALVVDIPTGFHITENELPGSVIVGQFPRPNAVTEFFGFVLEKNSPLTACVSAAVDALYADGTLERLATEWITDSADAPVLE